MKLKRLKDLPQEFVSHNKEIRKKVFIKKGEIPHMTNFSIATFSPSQIAYAHTHPDMYEVFFVEAGIGVIEIDKKVFELKKGSCVIVEPGESHEIRNESSEDLIVHCLGVEI